MNPEWEGGAASPTIPVLEQDPVSPGLLADSHGWVMGSPIAKADRSWSRGGEKR